MQISTLTSEYMMFVNTDIDIEITRWPTILTSLTFTGKTNTITIIDTGWYLYRYRFRFTYPALTMTIATGVIYYLSITPTLWTGLLNGKHTLLHAYLSLTATGRTIYGRAALPCTRTITFLTAR